MVPDKPAEIEPDEDARPDQGFRIPLTWAFDWHPRGVHTANADYRAFLLAHLAQLALHVENFAATGFDVDADLPVERARYRDAAALLRVACLSLSGAGLPGVDKVVSAARRALDGATDVTIDAPAQGGGRRLVHLSAQEPQRLGTAAFDALIHDLAGRLRSSWDDSDRLAQRAATLIIDRLREDLGLLHVRALMPPPTWVELPKDAEGGFEELAKDEVVDAVAGLLNEERARRSNLPPPVPGAIPLVPDWEALAEDVIRASLRRLRCESSAVRNLFSYRDKRA